MIRVRWIAGCNMHFLSMTDAVSSITLGSNQSAEIFLHAAVISQDKLTARINTSSGNQHPKKDCPDRRLACSSGLGNGSLDHDREGTPRKHTEDHL